MIKEKAGRENGWRRMEQLAARMPRIAEAGSRDRCHRSAFGQHATDYCR